MDDLALGQEPYAEYDPHNTLNSYSYYNMSSWPPVPMDTGAQSHDELATSQQQQQQQQHQQRHQLGQQQQQQQPQNQQQQQQQQQQPSTIHSGQHSTIPSHQFQYQTQIHNSRPLISSTWYSNQPPQSQHLLQNQDLIDQTYPDQYANPLNPLPMSYLPQQQMPMNPPMSMPPSSDEQQYMPFTTSMESYGPLACYQNDLHHGLVGYSLEQHRLQQQHQNQRFHASQQQTYGQAALLGTSPSDHYENLSSSGSESGWQVVDYPGTISRTSFESYREVPVSAAVSNPSLTLHIRSNSDSSQPELPGSASSVNSLGSYEDVSLPLTSPESERGMDFTAAPPPYPGVNHQHSSSGEHKHQSSPASSPSESPTSPASSASSANTQRRKKEAATTTKTTAKPIAKTKPQPGSKKLVGGEKRVGRRRGPLRPEQRAQAGEIRKLRACLRCKFLKKTCDKGDVCAGCQPSHARLWQVPCTRIDIKDIGYFAKDWKADYERHVTLGFSVANIRGYSPLERQLFITHGFGYILPIQAREIFVRDEECFNMDWIETCGDTPQQFDVPTARLTAGVNGISMQMLSEYLDRHIDEGFERFVNQQFEGTAFLTEMLLTAFKYYQRTQSPIIRKSLKLILAYNLTQHITIVEGLSEEEGVVGRIDDEESKYFGKTLAPVMINFHIKHSLAMMWRELQRDVLEELSALYSSVYSGEKLKHWPTIFMLASVLLAVWEEIQFDSHYRQTDPETVKKFCNDMESVPVGVIVGLFSAISQKLPALKEWDTTKHHQLLGSNGAVCDALTEVREHVLRYEEYLTSRQECKFDRNDFDSLSNKFLSKLVIRVQN